ncbi:RnfABCDGE type electron transport complex subunit D [Candidatus Woesearchaeota archaeon]|nr:RnfABCDGE type electron transport complex subunit D [Candidatus Woesearchaeota archaeon]
MKFFDKINVYNLMIIILTIFSIIGIINFGYKNTLFQILIAVITAGLLDTVINSFKNKKFVLGKSGIITGFFIGLILNENQIWYVPLSAAIIAIIGKNIGHLIMKRFFSYNSHLFNPAMFSIFFSILIFKTNDGWLGASNLIATIVLGLILMYKFNKFKLTLSFLITYFIINIIYNLPNFNYFIFLNSTLYFFAFFMLIEPKTSPSIGKRMVIYGIGAGVIIGLLHIFLPKYELTLGLLISNLFVPIINEIAKINK